MQLRQEKLIITRIQRIKELKIKCQSHGKLQQRTTTFAHSNYYSSGTASIYGATTTLAYCSHGLKTLFGIVQISFGGKCQEQEKVNVL